MRRALTMALLSMAAACPALASDAAESVVTGFSADGRYFAFEQFGTQDGSGFPYSDIFIVDLESNNWVEGTPVRTLIEDETATLGTARAKSAAQASSVIERLKIKEPGLVLASTPATEVQENRTTLTFDLYYRHVGGAVPLATSDLWATRVELQMSFKDITPVPVHCADFGEPVKALTITLKDLKTGASRVVHEDKAIPKSRGCPSSYDFDKAVIPAQFGGPPQIVALVGVYQFGFEGQDRRYIAIPIGPE